MTDDERSKQKAVLEVLLIEARELVARATELAKHVEMLLRQANG